MKILIVGGSGFLGCELARQSRRAGHDVAATYLTRPGEVDGIAWKPLDIRRHEDVAALADTVRPGRRDQCCIPSN